MKRNMDAVMIVIHGLLNVVHTQQDCNVNTVSLYGLQSPSNLG
jgi:hypothetical protein